MTETRIVEYKNTWEASRYETNSESIPAMTLRGWTFGGVQAKKDGGFLVVFQRPTTERALVARCYEDNAPFEVCLSNTQHDSSYGVRDVRLQKKYEYSVIRSHIASFEEAKACAEKLNKEWVDNEVNKYFVRKEAANG